MKFKKSIFAIYLLASALTCFGQTPTAKPVEWRAALRQKPEWYRSSEAAAIADQVLLFQKKNGGWDKNIDMAKPLSGEEKKKLADTKPDVSDTTIDNGATVTQLRFLARVLLADDAAKPVLANNAAYRKAFLDGIDYLISAQYPNGGWPQFFPLKKGYYTHITFNDNAMVNVLELLRNISGKGPEAAIVDDKRRQQAAAAVTKGTEIILKTQIEVKGVKTAWCAQHDEKTLAPAPARNYEIVSLSGLESVGIVKFLMGIDNPSTDVKNAINSAVKWFESVKISGIKTEDRPLEGAPKGFDRVVVEDKNAPPLWARFYEIGTNRPLFTGRDKIVKYSLAEIEIERRTGYGYYTDAPADLIAKDYPKWLAKFGATK